MIFILTIGVFSIINTEMGVIGILPLLAERFGVSIPQAGLLISLFALAVAFSGPVMPLLFSGMERKKVMLLVLGLFALGNIAGMCTDNFAVALAARVLPAFLHPVYCSLAFSVAGASVPEKDRLKAVAKVIVGVSAGMVLGVPISSFVAANFSLDAAMAVFAAGNLLAFAATLVFVPHLPVEGRTSCKEQLVLLKRPVLWLSIAGIIFMNGAVFGVFGFFLAFFGKFFPEIVFSLVIKSKRRICKEFFLPIAEEIWLNIVFNSKDIKFFFSLKQLEYEVGFKFSTEISS